MHLLCRVESNTYELDPGATVYQGQAFTESVHYIDGDPAATEDEAWASAVERIDVLNELEASGTIWVRQSTNIGAPDDTLGSITKYGDGEVRMEIGRRHGSFMD